MSAIVLKKLGEPAIDFSEDRLDVSFFVPCYNEERNVVGAIDKLSSVASQMKLRYEILIFNDCSSDKTEEVVEEFQAQHPEIPVRLFANATNQGVARNFFEGAFHARGKYYRLVCGDDIEPIETHLGLLRRVGEADIIIPYYTKIGGRKLHRHVLSRLFTWLVNFCSGNKLHYYNGCPIYRRWDVLRFNIETTGMGYGAEFLTRLLHEGRSYVEVPLVSIDREGSVSLRLRNFLSVGHTLLKILLRRLRIYLFK